MAAVPAQASPLTDTPSPAETPRASQHHTHWEAKHYRAARSPQRKTLQYISLSG